MFYKLSTADIRYFQAIMFPVDVSVDVKAKKESFRTINENSLLTLETLILWVSRPFLRITGLEPARRRHQNLNLARLPIPPYPLTY